jgi:hypothetical protein
MKYPADEAFRQPRVGAVHRQRLPIRKLRRDHDVDLGILRGELVFDRGQVPVTEGDKANGTQTYVLAGWHHPAHVAPQGSVPKIEGASERQNFGRGQQEGFVVNEQLQCRSIGTVQHALAEAGKAVGVLAVRDRTVLVEAVEEHPRLLDRRALLDHAAHAQITVR